MAKGKRPPKDVQAQPYQHPTATSPMRPEVGTQAQFQKKKPPKTYHYDSSLSPSLEWDENPAREQGEALIREILEADDLDQAKAAASQLKAMSKPFLNWAGKAERLSFDVPTLPLFIHERLSTQAIIETLKGHKRDKQLSMDDLFGDPHHSIADQVLKAYEHPDKWVNRMILGDSLVVMNSLLEYEGMGGKVQMIYMDPPYGISFGSNFQPFVRKRDVSVGDDEDLTREPEMVQAYRDTWELGLHSYLSYVRDRLFISKSLLADSGSVFVQISDANLHRVRMVLDEVFGDDNFCAQITYRTSSPLASTELSSIADHVLWYAKNRAKYKFFDLFTDREIGAGTVYTSIELSDGSRRKMTTEERSDPSKLPRDSRVFCTENLVSSGYTPTCIFDFEYEGRAFSPTSGKSWKTNRKGMEKLAAMRRLDASGSTLRYVLYLDDYPVMKLTNLWTDSKGETEKLYVVQTAQKIVERCMLMTTQPGDLVLDPTCGSGTTALVAELWGRRWITTDVSRVPLALARQRQLTATYEWYELIDESAGPSRGFVYRRKQNKRGAEIGGIVPHLTAGTIANDELTKQIIVVDRPETKDNVVRVTGPFAFEATIPTPMDGENGEEIATMDASPTGALADRMLEILRRSPVLHLGGNTTAKLKNVRLPAKALSLSAEALIENGTDKPVALVFGPENGAVNQALVFEAAKEANVKGYAALYVFGFAIEPNARTLIENSAKAMGIPAWYIAATPDLMMSDLLKTTRSSQIFSVCGLPEFHIKKLRPKQKGEPVLYQVVLTGLDTFDPVTMEHKGLTGDDVPAWLLDANYNALCFHVDQAFFPRTGAWDSLRKALKGSYEEGVWEHLSGTTSAPFEAGEQKQVAVKVIDDRGNELVKVKPLSEAKE